MKNPSFITFIVVSFFLVLCVLLPLGLSTYWIRFVTTIFMWIGLSESWNTLSGYTGYVNFGHVVFFGIGSYITALTVISGWPITLSILISGPFCMIVAAILAFPMFKLRGAYFAILTWVFAEAIKQLVLSWDILGGAYGQRLPPYLNPVYFYYFMFLIAIASVLSNLLIEKVKFGYNLKAIRDSETAAEMIGIDTFKNKLIAYVIGSFFAGIIGGAYGTWISYIHPFDVFTVTKTGQTVIMTLIGGSGTFYGPIIGATFMIILQEIFWTKFTYVIYHVFVGLAIAITILFIPEGFAGFVKRRRIERLVST